MSFGANVFLICGVLGLLIAVFVAVYEPKNKSKNSTAA